MFKLKSLLFLVLPVLLFSYSYPQNEEDPEEGFEVEIVFLNHENIIEDGEEIRAVLKGRVAGPTVVMLHTVNRNLIKGSKILLENTSYKGTIDSYPIRTIGYETASTFHNVWINFFLELRELGAETSGYTDLHKAALEAGNTEEAERLLELMGSARQIKTLYYKQLGYEHPENLATAYIYTALPSMDEEFLTIYEGFSPELKNSEWGKTVKRNMDAWNSQTPSEEKPAVHPLVGQTLPSIEGFTPDGTPMKIDQKHIAERGAKLTLIDFWASWCAPCRTINTALYPLYFQYKDQGLQIYSFSIDANKEKWIQAIEEDNIPWENFSDLKAMSSPVRKDFSIVVLPTNVLVDESGTIVAVNVFSNEKIIDYLNGGAWLLFYHTIPSVFRFAICESRNIVLSLLHEA